MDSLNQGATQCHQAFLVSKRLTDVNVQRSGGLVRCRVTDQEDPETIAQLYASVIPLVFRRLDDVVEDRFHRGVHHRGSRGTRSSVQERMKKIEMLLDG